MLADLQRQGGYVWAYSKSTGCDHRMPLTIAPFAIPGGVEWAEVFAGDN